MTNAEWVGVILAAGKGVRMRSSTPKTLHPVCGAPLLAHVAAAMRGAGLRRVVAVASPTLKDDPRFTEAAGPGTAIAVQHEQLGTADAVLAARAACARAKQVIVGAGDMPLVQAETVKRMIATHVKRRALVTVLVSRTSPAEGLGRVRINAAGDPVAIIEQKEASESDLALTHINTSWYCFDAAWLWGTLPAIKPQGSREAYLTDLVAKAVACGRTAAVEVADPVEAFGVNDRAQLARAEAAMRQRVLSHWMAEGVTLQDPATTYIDAGVTIGQDTVIFAGVHLRGKTSIGRGCEVGPNTVLSECVIGVKSKVIASFGDGAKVGDEVSVGPYSRLRPGTVIGDRAYIGNFAEVKNSRVGEGTHIGHFSYVGDSELGKRVNIGAGTVTTNFDGKKKNRTVIGDGAYIGSASMLVAPRTVGKGAATGAGAIVTRDIPDGELWVGNPARFLRRWESLPAELDQ